MSRDAGPDRSWADAVAAACLLAIDPEGLVGVHLRARAGPARDRWVDLALGCFPKGAARRRLPAGCDPARLAGGLDVAATLAAGRPILDIGLLAAAHGGTIVVPMAERLDRAQTATVCAAIDRGAVRLERDGFSGDLPARFALLALDEGAEPGETIPFPLAERLAFAIDLSGVAAMEECAPDMDTLLAARSRLPGIRLDDGLLDALAALAMAHSPRRLLFLVRATRAAAAMRGSPAVETEDAALALRLVLGVQAVAEAAQQSPPPPPPDPAQERRENAEDGAQLADVVLEAAAAVLPPGLLEGAGAPATRKGRSSGAGAARTGGRRGPAVGIASKAPYPGARPDVLATLRAAAPWQAIRRGQGREDRGDAPAGGIMVRTDDFRWLRRREPQGTTVVFVVDASGSAAAARLAEAKGAVELLLAESYRRRDEVALIAFRGTGADLVLPPTRSLVRAKRALAALPGGGGTPLADAILAADSLAGTVTRTGREAVAVFLTDGRPNIGFGGAPGRQRAAEDAERAAAVFRAGRTRGVVIDTASRPQAALAGLARRLGAEYSPLPHGDSRRISRELSAHLHART
ncbi:VWA domain-containing protein [Aquibium microcysteis]|uniref:VWA domain-containing protein n=1 Tax=Aquibium microcysteis TaxID=675281 RepID=UPI00165D2DEF|nr:VWA domain-containing protein [Aquibium microcysteis]